MKAMRGYFRTLDAACHIYIGTRDFHVNPLFSPTLIMQYGRNVSLRRSWSLATSGIATRLSSGLRRLT